MANRYYYLSHGLRGCYMPDGDGPTVIAVSTRKELHSIVRGECDMLATESTVGWSKRSIAAFVAECWRRYKDNAWTLDMALPCKDRGQSSYSYGLFLSRATRGEYLERQKEGEII